ncbi:MAG: glycosyltransferase family 2 protein [Bacteroidetes bacterium]|nr:glycosyltransferase family 2 protein [Bacteroidota bacterium]
MVGFSIVVCTYNGAKKLNDLFRYLLNLKIAGFELEVLIIDNNSSDNTFELASFIASTFHQLSIRVLKEKKQGKVNALITGFDNAQYEYLVICDDDNWLSDDYLLIAFEQLSKNATFGILGGMGIPHEELILPEWFHLHENAWAVGMQDKFDKQIDNPFPSVWGAGMVIRKSTWVLILKNGFVSFLTGKTYDNVSMAGEDTELCLLVKSMGFDIHFDENLKFIHAIDQYRLTWNYLLQLKIGFARSQVYFDIYKEYFNNNLDNVELFKKYIINKMVFLARSLVIGASSLDFYKSFYIAFFENRIDYQYGLEKRKQFYSLKELFYIFFNYKRIYAVFSHFNFLAFDEQ